MSKYNPNKVEPKWQVFWREKKIFQPNLEKSKKPFYNLMMFPYPSAEGMHIGNMYAFTGSDIYGRYKKLTGFDLFEPIGLDGFGIHSENFAIKKNIHPAKMATITKKNFYRQLQATGNAYAWKNTLETYDPNYYKWTQWIFLQMYKNGLVEQKTAPVNWCSSCKTVLADEQVEDGVCERCKTKIDKKDLKQWFFKITSYAERLYWDINKLDWSEKVKVAQKNWIGRSEGSLIKFPLVTKGHKAKVNIEVFTTRADTLFGVTYLVLAPEHSIIENLKLEIGNWNKVAQYIKNARKKSDMDRTELAKNKTGVEVKGIKAINSVNGEEIPIWVADYVLPNYGTGAVMAVPAHDERDWEFAKKYGLPIREVIVPKVIDKHDPPKNGAKTVFRKAVQVILTNPKNNKVLVLKWKNFPWTTFITGGIEKNEDTLSAAKREILEETGYRNVKYLKTLGGLVESHFYANHKKENRKAHFSGLVFELIDEKQKIISDEEKSIHECVWLTWDELEKDNNIKCSEYEIWITRMQKNSCVFSDKGVVINSDKFNGLDSKKAAKKITEFVGGKLTVNYKLRDWLISRQRYWGPPIPLIHCKTCGIVPVPEKKLPVLLPNTENWHPKGNGQSPLANIDEFVNTTCPKCSKPAKRETDVSDTFLDSSWYLYRYLNSQDKNQALDKLLIKKWLPVDMYIGGAEHSVLHLLYVRFLTYVFHDLKLIDFNSPFKKFRAHGLIIKDGAKMSKSKGNVIVPDNYINKYGADVLRMYLMFIGPFTEGGDFRDDGLNGITRFLEKFWNLNKISKLENLKPISEIARLESTNVLVNQTIKKVTEDIENLRYNTAISAMMILLNEITKNLSKFNIIDINIFTVLLSPFAPHICEEIWRKLGHKKSIFLQRWPNFKTNLVNNIKTLLIIQINGKVRDKIELNVDTSKENVIKLALASNNIKKYISSYNKIKKIIYIKNKILSLVI